MVYYVVPLKNFIYCTLIIP